MLTRRSLLRGGLGLGLGAALWWPNAHRVLRPATRGLDDPTRPLPRWVEDLLARHLHLWEGADQADITSMREANPEWDFMGRTFLVLALTNLALRDPNRRERHLAVIDRILADTEQVEADRGQRYFLLPYGRYRQMVHPSDRTVFVDGEIALMQAARLHLAPDAALEGRLAARIAQVAEQMGDGPVLCAESYPDECWTFCNTTALAAIALADPILGTDHRTLFAAWVRAARDHLTEPDTGLLVSSFTLNGTVRDGPEGSSIWISAHNLLLIDPDFAHEQYALARDLLARRFLGFGYAKEWAEGHEGPMDIDSGPIVPIFEASTASSGLAFVGTGAFGDTDLRDSLLSSLRLAAFPTRTDAGLVHLAGNQVGDAVLLYGLVQGPLWDAVGVGT